MEIQTVLGKMESRTLRYAQCHEHILIAKGRSFEINPALCIDDVERSCAEVQNYGKAGGQLIVDAQPIGCGRMSRELAAISEKTKVSIVASTGFHKMLFYPDGHWIHNISKDEFTKIMVQELTEGMFVNCDHHFPTEKIANIAGMIKVACDQEGFTPRYERLFDAAVEAQLITGAPIQCHIEAAEQGPRVAEYFLDKGVKKEAILLAHLDRDLSKEDSLMQVAELGVYLQLDTIGRFKYHDDLQEVELLKRLISSGHGKQILIGLDTTRERMKEYSNLIGLDYILNGFIPLMETLGIFETDIVNMIQKNPQKALSFHKEIKK